MSHNMMDDYMENPSQRTSCHCPGTHYGENSEYQHRNLSPELLESAEEAIRDSEAYEDS